jgi:NaMN:DMB phosphoribosyltransferase
MSARDSGLPEVVAGTTIAQCTAAAIIGRAKEMLVSRGDREVARQLRTNDFAPTSFIYSGQILSENATHIAPLDASARFGATKLR